MRKYYEHQLDYIINIKKIITIENMIFGDDFYLSDESHDFYEFLYVGEGNATYVFDYGEKKINKNEFIIVEPNKKHEIKGHISGKTSLFIICFECSSPFLAQLNSFSRKLKYDEKNILKTIFDEANKTYKLPLYDKKNYIEKPLFGGEQTISLYLELLLITLIRNTAEFSNYTYKKTNNQTKNLFYSIIDYLNKSKYQNISIPEICKYFGYSKNYICNLFKTESGETIIEYFNKLKIEEAKKMLINTNYTSEEISNLLSFSDPRYFLFLFKKITGITPKNYKNRFLRNEK